MEDSSLRLIYDCRFAKCAPPRLWRLTNTLTKVRNKALTHKDVKNEECSSEFFENKGAKNVLLRV
jgi:hypothetical protein